MKCYVLGVVREQRVGTNRPDPAQFADDERRRRKPDTSPNGLAEPDVTGLAAEAQPPSHRSGRRRHATV